MMWTRTKLLKYMESRRAELGWSLRRIATEVEKKFPTSREKVTYDNLKDFRDGDTHMLRADKMQQVLNVLSPGNSYGFEETCIAFQSEPTLNRHSESVIKKEGRYFLRLDEGVSAGSFVIEVRDDSMNLAGYIPGDFVLSDLRMECQPGDIVIAQRYEGMGAETIIRRYEPPFLLAHSLNPSHRQLEIGKDDVRLVSPVLKCIRIAK
jgi:phage repressor protein C with HTH and peptisase S24 domain